MKLKIRDMRTTGVIEFEGFKFKNTEFQFKKEMNSFFNEVLIDSPQRFINTLDRWNLENMHIAFSQFMLMKVIAFSGLGMGLVSILAKLPSIVGIGFVVMAAVNYIASKKAEKRLDNINYSRGDYEMMAEGLDEVREDLIKEKNSK